MPQDYVKGRGQRKSTLAGTSVFVGLRAIDPLLQRAILQSNPLASLFPRTANPPTGGQLITTGGLNLPPFQAVVWAMSVGSAVKQIYWLLGTSKEPMYIPGAIAISLFNTVNNSLNTLLFTTASSQYTLNPYSLYAGAALYTIGILVEPISETQRKIFKDKSENQGKVYAGGFFSLARNINYGAYTIWRSGMALACGGPLYGGLVAAFFTWDFATRAIPVLESYCGQKYGEQWKKVEKEVPYRLFPRIY